MPNETAACVAVVGPANAGKSTLLHQLDEKLQPLLDSFLVMQGNPDGIGRYLYHSPDLRNDRDFKKSIKGEWGEGTVDRICEWVTHGRRNLSLALLDFGGRHDERTAEGNARMLRACSHYLVVARTTDPEGASFWDGVCREHGLVRVGWMRSWIEERDRPRPGTLEQGDGVHGSFQVDVRPGDPANDAELAPLVDKLVALSRPPDRIPYVDLDLRGDWLIHQIPDVAGRASKIVELALRTGVVVLGGGAPIWAYLAGLRRALAARPDARVFFYDPRQPISLVEIPAAPASPSIADAFTRDALELSWREDGGRSVLELKIATANKFLPPSVPQNLASLPICSAAPTTDVGLSGKGPTWLHGTYARWLIAAGARRLAVWDGRSQNFVQVWE
jgi:hypothetical protein